MAAAFCTRYGRPGGNPSRCSSDVVGIDEAQFLRGW